MVNKFSAGLNYLDNGKMLKVVKFDKYQDKNIGEFPIEISLAI